VQRERKVVTVLFADLVGFTARAESLDPEDVEAILRPYHGRLRSELERHGGTLEKFIGDAVMALFGAPAAHEDDPERAVRAALAIREWAREEAELEVRIGITTGEALVTLGARPEAGEGMASGDIVNTAARLQAGAAANGILVDATTYRATERPIEYRESEPVEAKGKAEPVPVWEPLQGPVAPRGRRAPSADRARRPNARGRRAQGRARSGPGKGVSFWSLGEMVKAHLKPFQRGRTMGFAAIALPVASIAAVRVGLDEELIAALDAHPETPWTAVARMYVSGDFSGAAAADSA
jgi:class 3 adenylate cyclase